MKRHYRTKAQISRGIASSIEQTIEQENREIIKRERKIEWEMLVVIVSILTLAATITFHSSDSQSDADFKDWQKVDAAELQKQEQDRDMRADLQSKIGNCINLSNLVVEQARFNPSIRFEAFADRTWKISKICRSLGLDIREIASVILLRDRQGIDVTSLKYATNFKRASVANFYAIEKRRALNVLEANSGFTPVGEVNTPQASSNTPLLCRSITSPESGKDAGESKVYCLNGDRFEPYADF